MAQAALSDLLKDKYPDAVCERLICEKHGYYTATSLGAGMPFSSCPLCAEEARDKLLLENARRLKEAERVARLEREIPRRFRSKTFESYDVSVDPQAPEILAAIQDYAENFPVNLEAGRCLLLFGSPGTGKNHLAMSLVRHVITHGYTALIADAPDLIYRVRASWNLQASETEAEVLRALSKVDLLVINELGTIAGTETERRVLFRVINRRYEDQRPTIVIGNVVRDEAKAILGQASYDRLREDGGRVLVFDWGSYRERQGRRQ